jgi:hypothetical protein
MSLSMKEMLADTIKMTAPAGQPRKCYYIPGIFKLISQKLKVVIVHAHHQNDKKE